MPKNALTQMGLTFFVAIAVGGTLYLLSIARVLGSILWQCRLGYSFKSDACGNSSSIAINVAGFYLPDLHLAVYGRKRRPGDDTNEFARLRHSCDIRH